MAVHRHPGTAGSGFKTSAMPSVKPNRPEDHISRCPNVFALAGGALDHIIDVIGGAAYHGRQRGRVYLADQAVRVERPRLRSPGEGELAIPAYKALKRPSGLRERMLELRLADLSPEHAVLRQGDREDGRDGGRQQVLGEPSGG